MYRNYTVTTRILLVADEQPSTYVQRTTSAAFASQMAFAAIDGLTEDGFGEITRSADGTTIGMLRRTAAGPDIATVIVERHEV